MSISNTIFTNPSTQKVIAFIVVLCEREIAKKARRTTPTADHRVESSSRAANRATKGTLGSSFSASSIISSGCRRGTPSTSGRLSNPEVRSAARHNHFSRHLAFLLRRKAGSGGGGRKGAGTIELVRTAPRVRFFRRANLAKGHNAKLGRNRPVLRLQRRTDDGKLSAVRSEGVLYKLPMQTLHNFARFCILDLVYAVGTYDYSISIRGCLAVESCPCFHSLKVTIAKGNLISF